MRGAYQLTRKRSKECGGGGSNFLKSKRCSKKKKKKKEKLPNLQFRLQERQSGQEKQTDSHCNRPPLPQPLQLSYSLARRGELASFCMLVQRLHLLAFRKKDRVGKKEKNFRKLS